MSRLFSAAAKRTPEALESITHRVVRISAGIVVTGVVLLAAVWAAEFLAGSGILEASIWAAGFIFLGLSLESSHDRFGGLLFTGIALPILALLGIKIAVEFSIIAATVAAVWAGLAVTKALSKG
jgi:hypothetical protein